MSSMAPKMKLKRITCLSTGLNREEKLRAEVDTLKVQLTSSQRENQHMSEIVLAMHSAVPTMEPSDVITPPRYHVSPMQTDLRVHPTLVTPPRSNVQSRPLFSDELKRTVCRMKNVDGPR